MEFKNEFRSQLNPLPCPCIGFLSFRSLPDCFGFYDIFCWISSSFFGFLPGRSGWALVAITSVPPSRPMHHQPVLQNLSSMALTTFLTLTSQKLLNTFRIREIQFTETEKYMFQNLRNTFFIISDNSCTNFVLELWQCFI